MLPPLPSWLPSTHLLGGRQMLLDTGHRIRLVFTGSSCGRGVLVPFAPAERQRPWFHLAQAPEGPKGPPGTHCAPRGFQRREEQGPRLRKVPDVGPPQPTWEGMGSREGALTATPSVNWRVTAPLCPHLHPAGKFCVPSDLAFNPAWLRRPRSALPFCCFLASWDPGGGRDIF